MKWEKENNRIESMNMTTTMISAILEMVQSSLDLSLEAQGYVRIHDELEVRKYKKNSTSCTSFISLSISV